MASAGVRRPDRGELRCAARSTPAPRPTLLPRRGAATQISGPATGCAQPRGGLIQRPEPSKNSAPPALPSALEPWNIADEEDDTNRRETADTLRVTYHHSPSTTGGPTGPPVDQFACRKPRQPQRLDGLQQPVPLRFRQLGTDQVNQLGVMQRDDAQHLQLGIGGLGQGPAAAQGQLGGSDPAHTAVSTGVAALRKSSVARVDIRR